jgi:hypothetical protein
MQCNILAFVGGGTDPLYAKVSVNHKHRSPSAQYHKKEGLTVLLFVDVAFAEQSDDVG